MSVQFNFDAINNFAATIDASMLAGLVQAGEDIKDLASQLAPYDPTNTLHVRDTGEVNVIDDKKVEVVFGNGLPDIHAIVVEFGSVYQEAQPFLTPAATQIDVLREVSDHLFNKIKPL